MKKTSWASVSAWAWVWQKAPSGLEKAFANQPIAFVYLHVGAIVSRAAAPAAQAAENAREGSFLSQGAVTLGKRVASAEAGSPARVLGF